MNLQQKFEDVLRDVPASFGVAAKHLQSWEEAAVNGDRLFQMASTFKVPILATLFRDVEAGHLRLDQRVRLDREERVPGSGVLQELDPGVEVTVKDLAMLMIIVSDNFATDQVLNLVGTENVDLYMKELGFTNIHVHQNCWQLLAPCVGIDDPVPSSEAYNEFNRRSEAGQFRFDETVAPSSPENNVASVNDMNKLLESIAKKELISAKACDGMLDILLRQQFNSRIPYLLPNLTKVAHKTGTVGGTVNDVGIVYLPQDKGSIVISVLSEGNVNKTDGERTIATLAKTAYDYFVGV